MVLELAYARRLKKGWCMRVSGRPEGYPRSEGWCLPGAPRDLPEQTQ